MSVNIDIVRALRALLGSYQSDTDDVKKAVEEICGFIETYTNLTRPLASDYDEGKSIWNSDDKALNWSDGDGNWVDYAGNIT